MPHAVLLCLMLCHCIPQCQSVSLCLTLSLPLCLLLYHILSHIFCHILSHSLYVSSLSLCQAKDVCKQMEATIAEQQAELEPLRLQRAELQHARQELKRSRASIEELRNQLVAEMPTQVNHEYIAQLAQVSPGPLSNSWHALPHAAARPCNRIG